MGMPVARKDQVDSVACIDGTLNGECEPGVPRCDGPSTQATNDGATNVRVNGIGVVRLGDAMKPHTYGCFCPIHAPALSTCSASVRVNGLGIARIGDEYSSGHVISTGAGDVSAG